MFAHPLGSVNGVDLYSPTAIEGPLGLPFPVIPFKIFPPRILVQSILDWHLPLLPACAGIRWDLRSPCSLTSHKSLCLRIPTRLPHIQSWPISSSEYSSTFLGNLIRENGISKGIPRLSHLEFSLSAKDQLFFYDETLV